MSNILSVGETEIILSGFAEIHETACFIFKVRGVFIVSDAEDIKDTMIKCTVKNGSISNEKLIIALKRLGFDSNLFGKIHRQYFCEYPFL